MYANTRATNPKMVDANPTTTLPKMFTQLFDLNDATIASDAIC